MLSDNGIALLKLTGEITADVYNVYLCYTRTTCCEPQPYKLANYTGWRIKMEHAVRS